MALFFSLNGLKEMSKLEQTHFMLPINQAYQKFCLYDSPAEYYLKGLVELIVLCNLFAQKKIVAML